MKFSALALLSVPLLVTAQYGPDPSSAASSAPSAAASSAASAPAAAPTAGPGEHLVTVGSGGLVFTPPSVNASVNDTVIFYFNQSQGIQHSVTQSNFANPCTPLSGGFDSQLQPPGVSFRLTVTNASAPIWFYCKAVQPAKHCGMGMVGGINVKPTGNTIDAFISAAKAIGTNEGPQTVSGGLTGIGAEATAPAASATAVAPSASASTVAKSGAEHLTVGSGSLVATIFALFALA